MFDLSGRVALVTGGTRGIGYAIANALAAHGARVVISGESDSECVSASGKLRVDGIACDLRDDASVERLVSDTCRIAGGLDILISNAGIADPSGDGRHTMTDFDQVIALNLRAMVSLTNSALPIMAHRPNASVILISSIAGLRGNRKIAGYAVAKAGVAQLARNLAVQWGPKGVRTNAIAPGLIATGFSDSLINDAAFMVRRMQMTPLRRPGTADEVAGAAVFLASPAGGFVNGHVLVVDGGTLITDGS